MRLWTRLMLLLRPSKRRAAERDMADELAALRDLAPPGALGNLTLARENARAVWTLNWLEQFGQDLRYAWRSMRHNRLFTAMAVLSLALGIGANTAIYSFIESILLRSLPVADPDGLVIAKWRARKYTSAASRGMSFSTGGTHNDAAGNRIGTQFPYEALEVFERSSDVFSSAFCYFVAGGLNLTVEGHTEVLRGHYVSGKYFHAMGVAAVAGRTILPSDDEVGAEIVLMVSDAYARRRFGSPGRAAGQLVRLNNKPVTIVGVTPAGFFGAEPGSMPDVYMPIRAKSAVENTKSAANVVTAHPRNPGFYWIEIMGRLAPGVTIEQAADVMSTRFSEFVAANARAAKDLADPPALILSPGGAGLDSLRRRYAKPVYVLTGMVGLILLIACANLANLLLARALARRREVAVRLSMGASRSRIIRQMLTESLLLSSLSGLLGVAVAWWSIGAITVLLANGRENFTLHAGLNWNVLAVTTLLALATGALFGLAPALQATRIDLTPALKQTRTDAMAAASAGGRHRTRLGDALVVVQIAFSLILLVAAGLFGGTLANLHAIQLGFDRDDLLLFTVQPGAAGYEGAASTRLFEDLRQRLQGLPGVLDVSLSSRPLPAGGGTSTRIRLESGGGPPRESDSAWLLTVGPGFFRTMRIPVIAGREFEARDRDGSPKTAIINRKLATQLGVANPIGIRIALGVDKSEVYEVVGVVGDALWLGLKDEQHPMAYFSYLQGQPAFSMTFELRTSGSPLQLAPSVRALVREIDGRLAVSGVKTQSMHVDQAINQEIALARLCMAFAVLALVTACVGLYGTVAFNVGRRTSEIGIRMALGAGRAGIIWLILRSVLLLELIGLAAGLPIVLTGSRYVESLLYGIRPNDPLVLVAGVGILLLSGIVAGYVPARRALAIDPASALRAD